MSVELYVGSETSMQYSPSPEEYSICSSISRSIYITEYTWLLYAET